jgi:hypothetical protein
MRSVTRFAFFLLVLSALGSLHFLFAQGTDLGTIGGLVTDTTGAVVPNATVTILDLATNTTRATKANAQGEYRVFGLSSGAYQVSVSAPRMNTTKINGIRLNGSDTVRADAVLNVASATQTIEVTAQAPLVDTDDQTISDTITSLAVIDLPRDSRSVYSFLYLNPNITQGSADGEFKFLGGQSYGASFSLDGQRSNGGIFGEPTSSQPSLEAVGDINVLSNDFSAEYAGIANIRVTTKRGGVGYHGSAFYNNSNSALAAWTLQDLIGKSQFTPSPFQSKYPNPFFNITDIGGSVGGPIPGLKKTWFFAAYERNWTIQPVIVQSSTLPHPSMWGGDFSLVDDSIKPAVPSDVSLTSQEIANDTVGGQGQQFITIPSRLLNPTVQQLISTYFPKIGLGAPIDPFNGRIGQVDPVTGDQINGYETNLPTRSVQDLGTLRVDHDFSEKDRVYVTFNTSAQTVANTLVQTPYTGLGLTQNDRRNDTLSVSYTRVFNSSIVNEARAGFNHQKLRRHSNTTLQGFLSGIGYDQSDIDAYGAVVGASELTTFGHPAITFSRNRFAAFQNGGRNTDRPLDQDLVTFGDTFTWVIRKHNLRMGADFVRNAAVDGFAVNRGNPRGVMAYTGGGTNPFADFILGEPATSVTYINAPRPAMDVYNWEQGLFVQDDWKVSSRLTLNLGLRYELVTPFIENHDLLTNFDANYVDPTTGVKGRFIIPSDKTLPYLDTRILTLLPVVTAAQSRLGIGRGLVRMDKNNLAPRVGFALRLGDKSVVRGGYGFYYPTSAAQGIRDPIATNPFNQSLTKQVGVDQNGNTVTLDGWPGFQHGFSPLTGGLVTKGFGGLPSINVVPVGLQQPRIQQYNATYEREIARDTSVRVSYLGSVLSGLIAGVDLNELPASDIPFATTTGDGVTPCDPVNNGDCTYSPADLAREPFPGLGDYLLSYGNFGHGRSNAFQTQLEHRYSHGLMLNVSYTYLDQKSTGLDTGNSSLGGIAYNPFEPNHDYGQEAFVPKNRFVAYGVYDLPVGQGRKFGSSLSRWADTILGGWQTTFQMFAKSGTGFTPFWLCDDCFPLTPGNVGVTSVDAYGDFNSEPSFRPVVTGNYKHRTGNQIWDPNAFALPPFGADAFDNPQIAKRNLLFGPGTWGVNLGVHKNFHFGERVTATLGADIDNLFNHPLSSPDSDYGGGGGPFAFLGDFNMAVDPVTLKPVINMVDNGSGTLVPDITPNPDFGRLEQTFTQEGVANRRTIRLRLRITF